MEHSLKHGVLPLPLMVQRAFWGEKKNIEINNSLKNASEDNDSEYEYFKNNLNDLFHLYFAFLYIQGSHVIKVCV